MEFTLDPESSPYEAVWTDPGGVATHEFTADDSLDVDGDGRVGRGDIEAVVEQLNSRDRYDPQYDVNHDGRVSPRDALLLVNQYVAADCQDVLVQPSAEQVAEQRSDARQFLIASTILEPSDELVDIVANDFARIALRTPTLTLRCTYRS